MALFKENLAELEIGSTVESLQKFIDIQRELFHSQIDQLQNVVVTQCKLTGVNPLAQEMAAGALSIKIGKRPRDLLNPKAVKYMQALFSIKDAISKKESREISALFGVTVTQVRDFFASQRTRVRKQLRLSREKAQRSNGCKQTTEGVAPTVSDAMIAVEPVPLNSVGPVNAEEAPSCSTQDDAVTAIDELDNHFFENIFSKMQKEETFSGQVKLMEWILQIQNPSVLYWFLNKGGVMILATWLSQAAVEEQTTVLLIILKVLCHLPLQKALPEHMSAILQSVNKLRLYKFSDISNRARLLISQWSKMFARGQAAKKSNGLKSSTEAQNEILLKQSICEIMGDELWQSNVDNSEGILATSNLRKSESPQVLKLLPASSDESTKKSILGGSGSHSRERRKVQLVEQPGQKLAGKSSQMTRTVPISQSRPMSTDDIQKAKMRALYMQSKHGKTSSSNGMIEEKCESLNKLSTSQTNFSPPVSKVPSQPTEEQKNLKTSNRLEPSLDPKQTMGSKETPWEKCQKVKIPWHTPPEIKLNELWTVGVGESSKEIDVQRNRNRRERETFYYNYQDIPSNPKEPWDREMDYDDTLTPEIPIEQPPDNDSTETQVANVEHVNSAAILAPSSSQIGGEVAAEPDLELLAVLLKNPALVFALTSGQASNNLGNEETMKLLDMIKASNLNDIGKKLQEKVEVSLPSPTPPSNPGMSGWRPEAVRNPFSQQSQMGNGVAQASLGVGTSTSFAERLPTMAAPQQEANGPSLARQLAGAMAQLLPQLNAMTSPNVEFSNHGLQSNPPASVSVSPLIPTLSRPQTPQELRPQVPHVSDPPLPTHLFSTRPQVENIGPTSDPWRARQRLASNPHSQNNYNTSFGGYVSGNEYVGNEGFESWSPENSPNRSTQYASGRNYQEPRMKSGWSYRPDRSWQGNSGGYQDQNRQANRRWRERR
ncbi:hypothetical protein PTKIN_Ptkin12aG0131500 [Pterospermum kingtungense]